MAEEHGTDHCTAGLSAERIARNDAIFQHANEAISEVVEAQEIEWVPLICECADPACVENRPDVDEGVPCDPGRPPDVPERSRS